MCRSVEGGRGEIVGGQQRSDAVPGTTEEAQEEGAGATTHDNRDSEAEAGEGGREDQAKETAAGNGGDTAGRVNLTEAGLVETREMEELLILSALHVRRADVQREAYNQRIAEAVASKLANPLNLLLYLMVTLVVDCGQNMELPCFNDEQPGCTYYWSPLTVNNVGVVDHGYRRNDGSVGAHMHCHVYHEGIGKKGANNIASVIMRTLKEKQLIMPGQTAKKLTIVYDNCTGQNKNNTVLKLVPYLVEMKYFEEVEFLFLVVGHTKNACDRYFNQLKTIPRKTNTYTMDELVTKLAFCEEVTIWESKPEHFLDWGKHLGQFYKDSFRCRADFLRNNRVYVEVRQSMLETDAPRMLNVTKHNWPTKDEYGDDALAFECRKDVMEEMELETLVLPGINPYKQVEMFEKYRTLMPPQAVSDVLYKKPDDDVMKKVSKEKGMRKVFRGELADMKKRRREDRDEAKDLLEIIVKGKR
eukprot:scaffold51552_cov38-Cyclotella_meneghiniana.AAC.1